MAYNNGSLSQQQVKDMQAWYGTTADGKWGSNSSAAAGGLSAGQAYSLYSSNYKKYASYSDYSSYGSGSSGGSSYGGSSYKGNSGGGTQSSGINSNTIREMQEWYGTTADGIWGSNSTAAAGGKSLDEAYQEWSSSRRYYGSYADYQGAQSSMPSSGSGGSSYKGSVGGTQSSGINSNTIREMQKWYGTTADGVWGSNSTAAAGGKSLNDAYKEWSNSRRYYGSYADYRGAQQGSTSPATPAQGGGAGGSYGGSGSSGAGSGTTAPGYDTGYDTGYGSPDSSYDYSGPMSYSDYLARVGGDDYQAAVQKAIEAQVQAATDQYNAQIENTGKEYEEAARRAYVNKMMSQRNLDQELAANGVYGGMADSQRIATETNYENNLNDLTQQYQSTIAELQQAITSAKLAGDAQAAEAMANYLSQVQAQYASYLQNERSIQAEVDMFNRQLAAQQEQEARAAAAAAASSGGGYSGGSSYDAETAAMQQQLNSLGANLAVDGVWGPQTQAAYDKYMGGDSGGIGNYNAVKNNILNYASHGVLGQAKTLLQNVWGQMSNSQRQDITNELNRLGVTQ